MELELPSRRGLRPRARQIDRDLWLWFCRARHCHEHEGGPRVSKRVVQEEAKRVFHCAGITTFKASDGWYWRWLHRWRRLDPSSTSEKGNRDTENVQNKTAQKPLPKTVTTGKSPELEVTLSSTIETPESKLSTPSTKNLEEASIRLETINCENTLQKGTHSRRDDAQFSEQVNQHNQLLCGNNSQYWNYGNGSLSQEMMELGKLSENLYQGENLHNNCIQQEPNMALNGQLDIPEQCVQGTGLDSEQILQQRLSAFDHAFTNQTTISGKLMSYGIHLSNEQVLLNENITQNGNFSQMQASDSNQQIPLQTSDAQLFIDSGQIHVSQNNDQFCNNVMPLQNHGGNGYDKVSTSNGFATNSRDEQLNQISENLHQTFLPSQQLNQTSETLLNCSAIEDLNPCFESSKEVYDVIASMTSTFLSTSNVLPDPFCMPDDQSAFFESKNSHTKNVFDNDLPMDPIVDIDPRPDTNLMDVVLDPLNSDGQQYIGSCDSGIDVSPLATEDTATDFLHLPQNGNPFDSNVNLLNTSARDEECDMFLNFNSDDSVGITDLISLGDTDDCMNDDDSLPEDYLEFIDNYNDPSFPHETSKDDISNSSSMTDKSPASPGAWTNPSGAEKPRRTGGERYLPYFKQRVLTYAAAHTFKEAAARFHVNVDSITLWALKNREAVVKQNPEKHLLLWLRKCREMGHLITGEQLREKVKQLLSGENGAPKREQSGWFYVWAKRIANRDQDGSGEEAKETNKASKAFYPPAFKTEVALLAETTSKYNASLVFSVARKRVYEWLAGLRDITEDASEKNKDIEDTEWTSKSTGIKTLRPVRAVVQSKHRGRELTSSKIDKELLEWFQNLTSTSGRPTGSEVRLKAVELFRSHGHNKINCSHGWYRRWCNRHGLDIRHSGDEEVLAWCLQELDKGRNVSQRDLLTAAHSILNGTHKSQFKASAGWARRFAWRHGAVFSRWPQLDPDTSLPSLLARRAATFRTGVQSLIKERSWSAAVIGTMDEVPLSLTASGTSGRGTSLLHRPWPESVHATVILGCLANGELLPPTVVLKGEGEPERVTVEKTTVLVFRQQDAVVDETVLLQWLELVWYRSGVIQTTNPTDSIETTDSADNSDAKADAKADSLLILDSYEPHGSVKVRADLSAQRCRLAIIPAGCGSVLLPLASSAVRLFRTALEKEQQPELKTGNQPLLTTVASRVARAHVALATKKEMLRSSFEITGLTSPENSEEI